MLGASILIIIGIGFFVVIPYLLKPKDYQIYGKFSAHSLLLNGQFEDSRLKLKFLVLRPELGGSGKFNFSMATSRGLEATVSVWNSSVRRTPIIYDTLLYKTNGTFSLRIENPTFLFVNSSRLPMDVTTSRGTEVSFTREAGVSLVVNNVTSSWINVPSGETVLLLQLLGDGKIVIQNTGSFTKIAENDALLIILKIKAITNFEIASKGRLCVETNDWSSLEINSWNSPVKTFIYFPEGNLSYKDKLITVSGGQHLNMTDMRGSITLIGPTEPYALLLHGYTSTIIVGEKNITEFNIIERIYDYLKEFIIPTAIGATITIILTALFRKPIEKLFSRIKRTLFR